MEQIDSEPLSTSSRHTAFIIIGDRSALKPAGGRSGPTEPASRDATEHYSSCSRAREEPLLNKAVLIVFSKDVIAVKYTAIYNRPFLFTTCVVGDE